MKSIIIFSIVVLMLVSVISAQEISVTRSVPQIGAGERFTVSLSINVQSGDPSGLIISETIPEGWEITSADGDCNINKDKRLIKCLTYGENIQKTLNYQLQAPSEKAQPAVVTGDWKTLTESGQITGDSFLDIAEVETPPTTDNTLLLAIAAIVVIIIAIIIWKLKSKK